MSTAHFFSDPRVQQVVESFVELALRKTNIMKAEYFSEEEIELIKQLIELAGYEPQELVPGQLIRQYRSGRVFNCDFTVNKYCPFFVINQAGVNDFIATSWINLIFSVVTGLRASETGESEFILLRELKQILPFQPIRITVDGDYLKCRPLPVEVTTDRYQFTDYAIQDEDKISNTLTGIHKYCGGIMDCVRVTEKHKVLVCRKCHLRILIPIEIDTYIELREYMKESLS